ncbi:hypothetical protein BLNAU_18884 [Blattamonas nauphoetae]|uniref:Uncharacterized protein n=1 Tax=Blattamonas nauphoetae TaxID=2049346 RepID=A0ABQ9X377_9EUKA|nr:hypothetical protein BLNAU_18884 [Blattamonas nauphoetae]
MTFADMNITSSLIQCVRLDDDPSLSIVVLHSSTRFWLARNCECVCLQHHLHANRVFGMQASKLSLYERTWPSLRRAKCWSRRAEQRTRQHLNCGRTVVSVPSARASLAKCELHELRRLLGAEGKRRVDLCVWRQPAGLLRPSYQQAPHHYVPVWSAQQPADFQQYPLVPTYEIDLIHSKYAIVRERLSVFYELRGAEGGGWV